MRESNLRKNGTFRYVHLENTWKLLRTEQGPWDWVTSLNRCINEKVTRFKKFEKIYIKKESSEK